MSYRGRWPTPDAAESQTYWLVFHAVKMARSADVMIFRAWKRHFQWLLCLKRGHLVWPLKFIHTFSAPKANCFLKPLVVIKHFTLHYLPIILYKYNCFSDLNTKAIRNGHDIPNIDGFLLNTFKKYVTYIFWYEIIKILDISLL